MKPSALYREVVSTLEKAGQASPYVSDADEPDPRYRAYGVRSPEVKSIIKHYKPIFKSLPIDNRIALANRLLNSGYGEQKSIALHLYDQSIEYFEPSRFDQLDQIFRKLHGWSKVDAYTGSLLKSVLFAYPKDTIDLVSQWNLDPDMWLRRASVVLFTRKVALSGLFLDEALGFCDALKNDSESLVQKGVGWCLKDLMRSDKDRVLGYVMSLRAQGISSTITLYALRDIKGEERERLLAL